MGKVVHQLLLPPAAWLACALDRRLASASVSSKAIIAILSKTRPIARMVLLTVVFSCGQCKSGHRPALSLHGSIIISLPLGPGRHEFGAAVVRVRTAKSAVAGDPPPGRGQGELLVKSGRWRRRGGGSRSAYRSGPRSECSHERL